MVNTKLIKWVMASDYSARTWGHNPNGWPPLVGDLLLFFLCWVEWFWGSPYVKRGPKKKAIIITSYYFIPQVVMTLWVTGIFLCPKVKESKDTIKKKKI